MGSREKASDAFKSFLGFLSARFPQRERPLMKVFEVSDAPISR